MPDVAPPRWYQLSPTAFRRLTLVIVVFLVLLIGSGGWVRLSESGLGCPTWPKCYGNDLVAHASYHPLIEFVNRCVITAVGILTGLTFLAALFRQGRRRDLVWLAFSLGIGYVLEAVLGGITVLLKLAPALVAAHLVLAMVILSVGVVLHWRAGLAPGAPTTRGKPVPREVVQLGRLLLVAITVVVVLGTVATGSGPHSGSPGTPRFPFNFRAAPETHAVAGWFLFGLIIATYVALRVVGADWPLRRAHLVLVGMTAFQGIIGYTQYFLSLPIDLVEVHIVSAALLVAAMVRFNLRLHSTPAERPRSEGGDDAAASVAGLPAGSSTQDLLPERGTVPTPTPVGR